VADPLDNKPVNSNMQRFIWPGNRFIIILSSGNQQTIDAVIDKVRQDLNTQALTNLLTTNSLDETTDYIAAISVKQQKALIKKYGKSQNFDANFIVAGQIFNKKMETLLIYAQGNYIHEPNTSPFLQIGEIKFGKPILDRIIKREVNLNTAAHCALVSIDSTIRSNPIAKMQTELVIYKRDSLEMDAYLMLDENSAFFNNTSTLWDQGITAALEELPRFYWET
jgi:putative proteasome-type protease